MGIVSKQGVLADLGDVGDSDMTVAGANHALGSVLAEADRLTVLEANHQIIRGLVLLQRIPRTVVEDIAVLVDLDQGGALMRCCR